MAALNVRAPEHEPRAHRYVEQVIRLASGLLDAGAAYPRGGSVYFRGSDVAAANVCDALGRFSVSAAALAIVPLVGAWMALGAWLGREQAARSQLADGKRN